MKKTIYLAICLISIGIAFQANAKHITPAVHKKYVALTFDDGPNTGTTPLLLDILKAAHVHATFFMIGQHAEQYPDIVKRVYNEGHMIGNHTRDHTKLTTLSGEEVIAEIQNTQNLIHKITGYTPILFRPPYGEQSKSIIHELQLASVQWSLDSNDWELPSTGTLIERIVKNVEPGDIILMHDTLTGTIEAIPEIINRLKKNGYTLVTVGKLFGGYKYIHSHHIYRKKY